MLSMVNITDGKLAAFPGGVLLRSAGEGHVVGAVGVSGAAGDEDEYCALMGAQESGFDFITEPAQHSLDLTL